MPSPGYSPVVAGADVTLPPSAEAAHRVGARVYDSFGISYIYVRAYGAITAGTRFNIINNPSASTLINTSANATGAWENATGAAAALNQYFWARRFTTGNLITE